MNASGLSRVFEPIKIGRTTINNRIVRSAHGTFIGKGRITEELIGYHVARAKGGAGASFLEFCSPHPSSFIPALLSWDDSIIADYRRIKAAVAPHGMALFQQLAHGGLMWPAMDGVAWSSSATPSPITGQVGIAMSREDIAEVVAAFGQAARRCEEGGLDGLEIHAGHGYLVTQFLSPLQNRREDEYGGSLENRARFLRDILSEIKKRVSTDFPVGIRLSDEFSPHGLSVEGCAQVVSWLEADGLIDFIHGSQGSYLCLPNMLPGMEFPLEPMRPSSGRIVAAARKVPRILATGRLRTLEEAEQVLRDDAAELVVIQRAFIADPDLVKKTREGRVEQIRPCIACNQGCVGGLLSFQMRLGCAVNPAVGYEQTLAEDLIVKADKPLKVLVVGGGPGGMEAARLAALAGHRVTLAEASSQLGGDIRFASLTPRLHGIADITSWQEGELYRLGVEVRTNTYMEADDVLAQQADAVIVATGSQPRMDGIQAAIPGEPARGVDLPHVVSSVDLLTQGFPGAKVPNTALVFDDVGHNESMAIAQWLVEKGVAVTFVTRFASLAPTVATWTRLEPQLERLNRGEFRVIPLARLVEIRRGESKVQPLQSEKAETVAADIVVLGLSRTPSNELHAALRGKVKQLHLVGDARSPRDLQAAIREGHMAGRFLAI